MSNSKELKDAELAQVVGGVYSVGTNIVAIAKGETFKYAKSNMYYTVMAEYPYKNVNEEVYVAKYTVRNGAVVTSSMAKTSMTISILLGFEHIDENNPFNIKLV